MTYMAHTAAKDSWKPAENSHSGRRLRQIRAARDRELAGSFSSMNRSEESKAAAITEARSMEAVQPHRLRYSSNKAQVTPKRSFRRRKPAPQRSRASRTR